jgi:hypothetical protein
MTNDELDMIGFARSTYYRPLQFIRVFGLWSNSTEEKSCRLLQSLMERGELVLDDDLYVLSKDEYKRR